MKYCTQNKNKNRAARCNQLYSAILAIKSKYIFQQIFMKLLAKKVL